MRNILLVDDHKLLRQAVKRALIDTGYNIVGEAGEDGGVHGLALKEHLVELLVLRVRGIHE